MATAARITRRSGGPQFTSTRPEIALIAQIAARAILMAKEAGVAYEHIDAMMDLETCHCNGCPLKLKELLTAADGDFGHDAFGIRRFIDRETGKLGDSFCPRYAQRETS